MSREASCPTGPGTLHLRFEDRGGALLVTPLERALDAGNAPALRDAIGAAARGRALVVVSLRHVASMDVSALAALVAVLRETAPGGALRLVDAGPRVRALLARTHLDDLFPVYEDASLALRS